MSGQLTNLNISVLLKHTVQLEDCRRIYNDLFAVLMQRSCNLGPYNASDYYSPSLHLYLFDSALDADLDIKSFDGYVYEVNAVFHLYHALIRIYQRAVVHELMHQLSLLRPKFFYIDLDCHKLIATRSNAEEILFWMDHARSCEWLQGSIVQICHRSYHKITSPNQLLQAADLKLILPRLLEVDLDNVFSFEPCLHPAATDAEIELICDCFIQVEIRNSQHGTWSKRFLYLVYDLICNRRQLNLTHPDFSLIYRLMQKGYDIDFVFITDILFVEVINYEKYIDVRMKAAVVDQTVDFVSRYVVEHPEAHAVIRCVLHVSHNLCMFQTEAGIHPIALFPRSIWVLNRELLHTMLPYICGPDDYSIKLDDYEDVGLLMLHGPTLNRIKRHCYCTRLDLRFYGPIFDSHLAYFFSAVARFVHHEKPMQIPTWIRSDRLKVMDDVFMQVYQRIDRDWKN